MNPLPEIPDISGPMALTGFPWMMLSLCLAVLSVGLLSWLVLRRKTPPLPLPLPREIALRQLHEIATQIDVSEPIAFAAEVSDILRHFITLQFGLRAEYQTTPEFLATAKKSMFFSDQENMALRHFLQTADGLKFGDPHAGRALSTKEMLLQYAEKLVRGDMLGVSSKEATV